MLWAEKSPFDKVKRAWGSFFSAFEQDHQKQQSAKGCGEDACVLIALTDNLGQVSWNYTVELEQGPVLRQVWNYDDVLENHHDRLKVVSLAETDYNNSFSTAVLVIKTGDEALSS